MGRENIRNKIRHDQEILCLSHMYGILCAAGKRPESAQAEAFYQFRPGIATAGRDSAGIIRTGDDASKGREKTVCDGAQTYV